MYTLYLFIHPSLNHNAILGWVPAVNGNIDLRIKYTKFEQNDGMPDFPDGVKLKAYKNDTLIYIITKKGLIQLYVCSGSGHIQDIPVIEPA